MSLEEKRNNPRKKYAARMWELITPYWCSSEWFTAWALLLATLALLFGNVGAAVLYSNWNRDIYNALEARNSEKFEELLLVFTGIVLTSLLMSTYAVYLRSLLAIRWRRWLFDKYCRAWLSESCHYRLESMQPVDNPDQRLSEDIDIFTRLTLELFLSFIQTMSNAVTFSIILWTVSGSLKLFGFEIPGYMFWIAIAYSLAGSAIAHLIGKPLIGLHNRKQKVEANLRFDLMRIREHSESIALQRGEPGEHNRLLDGFLNVWLNFHALIRKEKSLSLFLAGYEKFSFVFPMTVAGPRLFSGALSFGGFMQLNQAFASVQNSLNWFIAVYNDLVLWRAVTDRILSFGEAMGSISSAYSNVHVSPSPRGLLEIEMLRSDASDGDSLLVFQDVRVERGEKILIQGPSGCGKSTFLRAVGGFSFRSRGTLLLPQDPIYIIPQRPYFPVGSLRTAVTYPVQCDSYSTTEICGALRACRLERLGDSLDLHSSWDTILSPGEQQRLAIARALLHRPKWLLLDEVTSALGLDDEQLMYEALISHLPDSSIISVGHRRSLFTYHDILWQVNPAGEVQQLLIKELP